MIEDAGVGLCSITGDRDLLVQNALRLADNKELRQKMAKNTRKLLLESFSVRHAAEQLIHAVDAVHCGRL
jgi:glycosyltransferase involved in cell wall biosynthesis